MPDPYTALAAAGIQYEANDREHTAQNEALQGYEGAWNNNRAATNREQQALMDALDGYSNEYSSNYGQLAQALGSPNRNAAGATAKSDLAAKIAANLKGAPAVNARAWTGTPVAAMAEGAGAQYQPVLDSQEALAGEQLAQGAEHNYDANALSDFQARNTDIGRRSTSTQRRAQLMGLYRDNLLQDAAHRYKYTGPSNGYNNAMLLAKGISLGGAAYGDVQDQKAEKARKAEAAAGVETAAHYQR